MEEMENVEEVNLAQETENQLQETLISTIDEELLVLWRLLNNNKEEV